MKALLKILIPAGAAVALILDSSAACAGATEGVQLCLRTVVPALFPFLYLSLVISTGLNFFRLRIFDPVARLCRIPPGSGELLMLGFLGGYPSGAQCVSLAHEKGHLSSDAARRMLVICSNCGPAFIFGLLGPSFADSGMGWKIWLVCILGAVITGTLLPGGGGSLRIGSSSESEGAVRLMDRAIRSMARICAWIIIFRVVMSFADRWFLWRFHGWMQVLICGLTELTNGCINLGRIADDGLRFVLCCGMLSFGGLCVTMQTLSVIHPDLDRKLYFPGKVLHGCISTSLSCIFFPVYWKIGVISLSFAILLVVYLGKIVKSSRFSQKIGV